MSLQNYNLVGDESELRQFYKVWIKPLQERKDIHELFGLIYLQSRRKYDPELSHSQQIIDRTVVRIGMSENCFVRLVRKFEIVQGLYVDLQTERPLPDHGLVLYMTMEPGREHNAWFSIQEEMCVRMKHMLTNESSEWKTRPFKLYSLYRTALATNQLNQFQKLDMDSKEACHVQLMTDFIKSVGLNVSLITETKNGYHVVLPKKNGLTKMANKSIYEFCKQNDWISLEKTGMLSIPGTFHAGHLVKIVTLDELALRASQDLLGKK